MEIMKYVFFIVLAVMLSGVLIVREVFRSGKNRRSDRQETEEILTRLTQQEQLNQELKQRVEVLETIVTDGKEQLKRDISSL